MLTFKQVSTASLERALLWHPGGLEDWSASDWAVALAGEVGEACNAIKKLNRLRDGAHSKNNPESEEEALEEIAEELADSFLYLDLLAQFLGIDLEAAIIKKFNAVSEREAFPQRLGGHR